MVRKDDSNLMIIPTSYINMKPIGLYDLPKVKPLFIWLDVLFRLICTIRGYKNVMDLQHNLRRQIQASLNNSTGYEMNPGQMH